MAEYQATEQGTPANPPSGERKLHPKTDGWYQLDSSGNEIKLDNVLFGTAAGTNTYTVSIPNHSTTAYSQSVILLIKFTNANTGASTLNINSIGATAIRKNTSVALVAGDIIANQIIPLVYDGANFQLTRDEGVIDAEFWVSQSNVGLSAEVNLGALTTGMLRHTVAAGVSTPSTATEGTDYYAPGGTDVAITDGGTGASTASTAATNLGLGTGNSPQFTAVNIGHATDTTIARSGAGDITVEGNQIYRAGGIDIPISDGGTGASTVQVAINTLTNAAGATNEHVLTKDTASGNAIFKAIVHVGAYRTIWIPASAMTPKITNGAAGATREYATNDIMSEYFLFDSITEEGVQFIITMPDEWNLGTVKYKIYWDASTGASAADLVSWGIKAGALSNDDAIDTALGTQIVVDDIVIAVGDLHVSPASAALTIGGTPALGDLCVFQIVRNVAGNDDMTEDAQLIGCLLQFQESTTEPVIW